MLDNDYRLIKTMDETETDRILELCNHIKKISESHEKTIQFIQNQHLCLLDEQRNEFLARENEIRDYYESEIKEKLRNRLQSADTPKIYESDIKKDEIIKSLERELISISNCHEEEKSKWVERELLQSELFNKLVQERDLARKIEMEAAEKFSSFETEYQTQIEELKMENSRLKKQIHENGLVIGKLQENEHQLARKIEELQNEIKECEINVKTEKDLRLSLEKARAADKEKWEKERIELIEEGLVDKRKSVSPTRQRVMGKIIESHAVANDIIKKDDEDIKEKYKRLKKKYLKTVLYQINNHK
ncbi:hypothetical protein O9G_000062 [Rozella allomycis CSF55]|uniref:Uncharacterized protein n=1 Tax=Rozella allomycis (strain CSF55) TaxID=988480 RepID=A0A075ANW8_ROZAC|nr:hypothetical protein O9G_000062 [Rozella allomycis CSF55]|eukprot:EPZ31584.1 hypothetical protein O9G_000062 [Rozella allomycis CSF55]